VTTPVAQEVKAAEYDAFLSCVAFSPDGHHIVSGSVDDTLRLWPGPAAVARPVVRQAH
jgi:WD domain, G-beta repeat